MFKSLIFVFIGSGFGGTIRYLMSMVIKSNQTFPIQTLFANILACLIFGYSITSIKSNYFLDQESQKLLLLVGFCGGLSTFTTYTYESFLHLSSRAYLVFVFYTLVSIIACLTSVWIGMKLASKLI